MLIINGKVIGSDGKPLSQKEIEKNKRREEKENRKFKRRLEMENKLISSGLNLSIEAELLAQKGKEKAKETFDMAIQQMRANKEIFDSYRDEIMYMSDEELIRKAKNHDYADDIERNVLRQELKERGLIK